MTEQKVVHSGYLQHRPGGALGRWKKKRYWFQLDEVSCKLRLYKSPTELAHRIGVVDMRDACISILPESNNHILVACGGKEHILIADNHRSMMQWLQNLQEVRDLFSCVKSHRNEMKMTRCLTYHPGTQSAPTKGLASCSSTPLSTNYQGSERLRSRPRKVGNLPPGFSTSVDSTAHRPVTKPSLMQSTSMPAVWNNNVSDTVDVPPKLLRSYNSIPSQSSTEENTPITTELNGPASGISITDTSDPSEHGVTDNEGSDTKPDNLDVSITETDDSPDEDNWKELDKVALLQVIRKMKGQMKETQKNYKSVENREQTYKQMLKKREQDIMHLDDKLGIMEQAHHLRRDLLSPEDMDAAQQRILDLQDTCKVYQEQNGFLNTEVRRQASLRWREQIRLNDQNKLIDSIEVSILQSRQDYFRILSQVIEVTSLDPKEAISLDITWEDNIFKRFMELHDEARQQDPLLPDPRVIMTEGHTDIYGFQHPINNQPLMFHYSCQILQDHIMASSRRATEHKKKWEQYVNTSGHIFTSRQDELRELVYDGIPTDYRSEVWCNMVMLRVKALREEKGDDYFQWLCNRTSTSSSVDKYRRQIELDLLRTMPHNIHFNCQNAEGIRQLRLILEAFCVHNPSVGYCQGMNFIAGTCLLFMDTETAFWCMVAVVESYFPANYFDSSLIGAQADQSILKDILELRLPRLHAHLDEVGIEMCSFTLNWFLAIFFEVVPFTMLLRIWDCFLFDGLRVLFQFSIALLQYHETSLLQKKDILAILKDTKSMAKLTQDVEGIVNIVKESSASFPSSAWIQQKQDHYMGILRGVYERQERAREEFERQEGLMPISPLAPPSNETEADLKMDCAVECYQGSLLVCRGELRQGWVGRVDVGRCIKQKSGIRLDNRIVCITMAGMDMALLGTVSNFLYAFSVGTQDELWFEKLRDTPLSIVHDPSNRNIYIGLADGTLAVIEGVSHASPSDVLYHAIGASAIRNVVFLPQLDQIWCSCGNAVNILNNSLNIVDGFEISKNPDVHISGMYVSDQGVWVTVRTSSIIMLWDTRLLQCVLVHDTNTDRTSNVKSTLSRIKSKVTSMLAYKDTLWVGTAGGVISIYRITEITPEPSSVFENGETMGDTGDEEGNDEIGSTEGGGVGDLSLLNAENATAAALEENRDRLSTTGTLKEFVIIAKSKGLPESPAGSDTDTLGKSRLLAKLPALVTSSDEEHRPPMRAQRASRKGRTRKGSRKGGQYSPKPVKRMWGAATRKKSTEEDLSPRSFNAVERMQSMFGKLSLGNGHKAKAYRYSQEIREEARRGSRICINDSVEPSPLSAAAAGPGSCGGGGGGSVATELLPPRSTSTISDESLGDVCGRFIPGGKPLLFDATEINVCLMFDVEIEAQRKISDFQVKSFVLTSLADGEPAIVSCAGFYGDDESILRWTCHTRENVWMQVPIEDTTT